MRKLFAYCLVVTVMLNAAVVSAAELDIDTVTGLYVAHWMNGATDGERYPSDNVLEIVRVSPHAAYFRTRLNFYNGHECDFSGVGEISGQSLVFRNAEHQCELSLHVAGGKIAFEDKDYHCREGTCGARGGYNGEYFKLGSRRPIRYMQILLSSKEYQDAVKQYQATHPQ